MDICLQQNPDCHCFDTSAPHEHRRPNSAIKLESSLTSSETHWFLSVVPQVSFSWKNISTRPAAQNGSIGLSIFTWPGIHIQTLKLYWDLENVWPKPCGQSNHVTSGMWGPSRDAVFVRSMCKKNDKEHLEVESRIATRFGKTAFVNFPKPKFNQDRIFSAPSLSQSEGERGRERERHDKNDNDWGHLPLARETAESTTRIEHVRVSGHSRSSFPSPSWADHRTMASSFSTHASPATSESRKASKYAAQCLWNNWIRLFTGHIELCTHLRTAQPPQISHPCTFSLWTDEKSEPSFIVSEGWFLAVVPGCRDAFDQEQTYEPFWLENSETRTTKMQMKSE